MEKRQRSLSFLVFLLGIFFVAAGVANTMFFYFDHYQELILSHNLITAVIVFMSFAVILFGSYLTLFCIEVVEKIEERFGEQDALTVFLLLGGSLFTIIGIGNLIAFVLGYYQKLSLVFPVKYFTIMLLSFFFIYFGFFVSRFRIIVSSWITKFFEERKKQQT